MVLLRSALGVVLLALSVPLAAPNAVAGDGDLRSTDVDEILRP